MKPFHTPASPENLVKIGPLDSEIPGLQFDHLKKNNNKERKKT